jgi:hypothetical protein
VALTYQNEFGGNTMKKIFAIMLLAALSLLIHPADAAVFKNKKRNKVADASSSSSSSSSSCPDCPKGTGVRKSQCLGCGTKAQYGYFYLNSQQDVGFGGFVDWTMSGDLPQDNIQLDATDKTVIVIKRPGVYLINYTVVYSLTPDTTPAPTTPAGQFALYLNGLLQQGTTFTGGTPISILTTPPSPATFTQEAVGPVLIRVDQPHSRLQLANQSENSLRIDPNVGTGDTAMFGFNVAASLLLMKVAP